MKYFFELLVVAVFIAGSKADSNAHYVDNTDPCESLCEYYGAACPIASFAPTPPGYDCNAGYCRLSNESECIAVDRNSIYVEHKDACESLCEHYGQECPIQTFVPTEPGFDCKQGYCRLTLSSICTRPDTNLQ